MQFICARITYWHENAKLSGEPETAADCCGNCDVRTCTCTGGFEVAEPEPLGTATAGTRTVSMYFIILRSTALFKLHPNLFSGSCRPLDPPLGRTGKDPIFWCLFLRFVCFVGIVLDIYKPWEAYPGLSHRLSRRMHSKSCLGTSLGPKYDNIFKNIYLCRDRSGLWPWPKRALQTISNGILKIPKWWTLIRVIRILWYSQIRILCYYDIVIL